MAMPEVTRSNGGSGANSVGHNAADPSILTTEALQREVLNINRELAFRQTVREREHIELRTLLEHQIASLSGLMSEQLKSIKVQFDLIEKQRVEQKKDTKDAVDAALIAQKEAVQEQTIASGLSIAKSEAATAKQLDQLAVTFSTAITGVTASVNDLKDTWNSSIMDIKERIGRMENMRLGAQEKTKRNPKQHGYGVWHGWIRASSTDNSSNPSRVRYL